MSDNTESAVKRKRTIQMKDFKDNDVIKGIINGTVTEQCIGRVVGVAYGSQDKMGTILNNDGSPKVSKLIIGDFQGVAEKTGADPIEAGSIYLPEYFAEEIAVQTTKNDGGISFAVEIWMEKNPRAFDENGYAGGVAYQYSVRNILERQKHDPLSQLKAQLAKTGKLGKLPVPAGLMIEAPKEAPPAEAPADPAPPAKRGK